MGGGDAKREVERLQCDSVKCCGTHHNQTFTGHVHHNFFGCLS